MFTIARSRYQTKQQTTPITYHSLTSSLLVVCRRPFVQDKTPADYSQAANVAVGYHTAVCTIACALISQ